MARFIDSDKLICQVQNNDKYGTIIKQLFISLLQNSETEDVAPVIHAHWERHFKRSGVYEDLWWYCSNCNGRTSEEYAPYWWSYCPYCSAKMDEVVE